MLLDIIAKNPLQLTGQLIERVGSYKLQLSTTEVCEYQTIIIQPQTFIHNKANQITQLYKSAASFHLHNMSSIPAFN